jgi:biopolymer transport protein ExbB
MASGSRIKSSHLAVYRFAVRVGIYFSATLPVAAQEAAEEAVAATGGNKSLWGLIQEGGWAMYPLALCSLAMLFLIFYCWKETSRRKFVPDEVLGEVSSLLQARDVAAAISLLERSSTVLSRTLRVALKKARPAESDANKEKVETSFIELVDAEEGNIGQWINYLNVVATVAPMVGLLGTVSGMIGAFSTIASGGMGRPELLAGDIGEALITTATGLVIGIPAMIAYFVLRNRLNNILLATTQSTSLLIDYLAGEIAYEGEETAGGAAVAGPAEEGKP